MSNFIEDCLKGVASLSEVDDYIDQWHESDEDIPLHVYLGMTSQEYSFFVKDENYLETILTARKENKDIEHILQDKKEEYFKSKRK
jgi:hypothetical protein